MEDAITKFYLAGAGADIALGLAISPFLDCHPEEGFSPTKDLRFASARMTIAKETSDEKTRGVAKPLHCEPLMNSPAAVYIVAIRCS